MVSSYRRVTSASNACKRLLAQIVFSTSLDVAEWANTRLLRGDAAAELAAATWLERLDVGAVGDARPGEISGGQAQRVAVARALIGSPSVIFADEPTGALDSLQGEKVMGLLTSAVRETGAALVLVTHEPRVAAYSAREVVVRDGRTSGSREAR